jgi:hypothetical protein
VTPTPSRTPTSTVTPTGKKIDIDGNGVVEALTDGLLILRRVFGFSGTTLTSGAVAGNCTRCDPTAVANYIDSILPMLDIDLSGEVTALTDGLLILRRLFGFSGATLINGALAGDCTRCDATAIANYIDSLTV